MLRILYLFVFLGLTMLELSAAGNFCEDAQDEVHIFLQNRNAQYFKPNTAVFIQNEADLWRFLPSYFAQKNNFSEGELLLTNTRKTKHSVHYTFQQIHAQVPVYNAMLKVNCTAQGKVLSVVENLYNFCELSFENDNTLKANSDAVVQHFCQQNNYVLQENAQKYWLPVTENKLVAAIHFQAEDPETSLTYHFFIDENEKIWSKYVAGSFWQQVVSADAKVFFPDPLTSAQVLYANPYTDQNDEDVAVLNDERKTAVVLCTSSNGKLIASNEYVSIAEFSQPSTEPVSEDSNGLFFTRHQSQFEDVNVLFHVAAFQLLRVQNLGFEDLNEKITVDAHGLGGDDNSYFNYTSNGGRIIFGIGGVDDAEDADVIIHEYGHALSYFASPGSNDGIERQAVDEAIGDYFAASYSRDISEFGWFRIFSWDGHNEYWEGRLANTDLHYPEDNEGSIYARCPILSSALMELWEIVGNDDCDALVLQFLYNLSPNINMPQAAQLLLDAEEQFFGGKYHADLSRILYLRGLIPYAVSLPESVDICFSDSLLLGESLIDVEGFSVLWSPANLVQKPNAFRTLAFPLKSQLFQVQVTNTNGEVYTDSIQVNVEMCLDDIPVGENIRVLNTIGFTTGNFPIVVQFSQETEQAEIFLYNVSGEIINTWQHAGNEMWLSPTLVLPPACYFLHIKTNKAETTIPLIRAY
ncbi:MAG: M4 family metallopeptidase [Chitinophagales bacterium]|nr:hypothetical protein [Bacteroidota bacterium]MCB9042312.1 hypothetical protein [Chitinophagales bacterium]